MNHVTTHPVAHHDQRGHIINVLELPESANPVRGAGLITSQANTIRSCHYHRTDGHWLHVISGEMRYYERSIGSRDWGEPVIVRVGQSIYTPPMVEHKTEFPVLTLLLSLSHNSRTHEEHEADLVRVSA